MHITTHYLPQLWYSYPVRQTAVPNLAQAYTKKDDSHVGLPYEVGQKWHPLQLGQRDAIWTAKHQLFALCVKKQIT